MDKEHLWRKKLSPKEYKILREKGTEPPFCGEHLHNKDQGTYHCKGCDLPLFESHAKYDSGSGWPSFFSAIEENVAFKDDFTLAVPRKEVLCIRCGGHLGHVFPDGPKPSGQRYCINSICLIFIPK